MVNLPHPSSSSTAIKDFSGIANKTVLLFFCTSAGLGLTYIYSMFLGRVLGPEQYGRFAIGLTIFNMLGLFSIAGLDRAIQRFIPAFNVDQDTKNISHTFKIVLSLSVTVSVILGLTLFLSSKMLAIKFFHDPEIEKVLSVFSWGIPAFALSTVFLATLQAFKEVNWRILVKYIHEPLCKIVLTIILFWAGWGLDAAPLAIVSAIVLSGILSFLPVRHLLFRSSSQQLVKVSVGQILTFSFPLFGALLFASHALRADLLILGYWMPASSVGIYSAAFQTSAIMALVLGSLESVTIPFLSETISQRNILHLDKLYKTFLRWGVITVIPIFLLIIVAPREILLLFGEEFQSGANCLVILAIGQFFNVATGSASQVLFLAGYSKLVLWNNFLSMVIQILVIVTLIPTVGVLGVAIGMASGLILLNFLRVLEVYWIFGVQPFEVGTYKALLSGIVAYLVVLTIRQLLGVDSLPILLSSMILSNFAILYGLGLHSEDRSVFNSFWGGAKSWAIAYK